MVPRRSPLAHLTAELTDASSAAVTLRERPFLAQLDLRIGPDERARAAVAELLGRPLPIAPGTTSRSERCTALWLGPDEWLLVGAPGSEVQLADELSGALRDFSAAVIDVSANRVTIELAGPRAREVLQKGCSIDLHPRAFHAGRCAQTLLARAQVVLEQETEEPAYRVFVRPSFSAYLAAWLMDATMEFRPDSSESRASMKRRQRSVRATSLNV
jgi:sarcosine oxidase subunit gamma